MTKPVLKRPNEADVRCHDQTAERHQARHYLKMQSSEAEAEAETESSLRRASFQKGCCRTPSHDNLWETQGTAHEGTPGLTHHQTPPFSNTTLRCFMSLFRCEINIPQQKEKVRNLNGYRTKLEFQVHNPPNPLSLIKTFLGFPTNVGRDAIVNLKI